MPEFEIMRTPTIKELVEKIEKVKLPMIDKLDDRPWDIVAAFRDLNQRLAMAELCQHSIIVDYTDVMPDHVVIAHDT